MSDWDGRGLPPSAKARLSRAQASGVATSLLSVNGQVGLDACGFVPVGEVMGCIAMHIGFSGYGGCGWVFGAPPLRTALSRYGGYGGFKPYLDAVDAGWASAIGRMAVECKALGGDGVVEVRLEERELGDGTREYLALGTAVRALGRFHSDKPFSTTLSGPDVAKLLQRGYMPAQAIVAISVGVRHDDYYTRRAVMFNAANQEVTGYSELVQAVRGDAREELARRLKHIGADGAILTGTMQLSIHELEVSEGHRDHMALAHLVATAIVRVGEPHALSARPLSILALSPLTRGAP